MNEKLVFDEFNNTVVLHKNDDFDKMRKAGSLASKVLDIVEPYVKEGVTTDELDKVCHEYILSNNAIPPLLTTRIS